MPSYNTVETCWGEYEVRADGVIDDNAVQAFTRGHCHSLALALHQETGWPLFGMYSEEEGNMSHENGDTPSHVLVQMPNGDFLDIEGTGAVENWQQSWPTTEPVKVTEAEVLGFSKIDYKEPNVEAARPFAKTLLSKYGQEFINKPYQYRIPFKR